MPTFKSTANVTDMIYDNTNGLKAKIKKYKDAILNDGNVYEAKKIAKENSLETYLISAKRINDLTDDIVNSEKEALLNGTNWLSYDTELSEYTYAGDYALI